MTARKEHADAQSLADARASIEAAIEDLHHAMTYARRPERTALIAAIDREVWDLRRLVGVIDKLQADL